MANKNIFQTLRGKLAPATDATNEAGGRAYSLSTQAALARFAVTGCLSNTFYATAEDQLTKALELCKDVDADFIARTAIHSREKGYMKDMPALLCAVLAGRDLDRLAEVFLQVIDNGRMLRNFVQIIRSGVTGRKSLGSAPKRLIRQWFEYASERQLINASIGNAPSLADIVKMVHPHPTTPQHDAFYGWLLGKPYDPAALPEALRAYEAWKANREGEVPDVPFQMLTALNLGEAEWSAIADSASWQMTRMNLNTFARHGVFNDKERVKRIVSRLRSATLVRKARVFPYQLLVAYLNAGADVPAEIREALQDAMEISISNVPEIDGSVVVCPDVSGSMGCSVTGWQSRGSASKVRCVDVAALVAASFLRRNPRTTVLPFECDVVNLQLNPRDSVMTNATRLAGVGGGGTNCSAPLQRLNERKAHADLVIYVSDNESWMDSRPGGRGTATLRQWDIFKHRNPKARLVCIDLTPNTTTQAPDRKDILNIGGFSDNVFDLIASFAKDGAEANHWVRLIESIPLKTKMKTA